MNCGLSDLARPADPRDGAACLRCEDMEHEDELSEELTSISDYLGPSSWIDREMMYDVPMLLVFPRDG